MSEGYASVSGSMRGWWYKRVWPLCYKRAVWVYEDTRELITRERRCRRCGRFPHVLGYDACLGYIPGLRSACCGHGIREPILLPRCGGYSFKIWNILNPHTHFQLGGPQRKG